MIRCFESDLDRDDISQVEKCIDSGILGFGPFVGGFEKEYAQYSGYPYNLGMNSASAAAYAIFTYLFEEYGVCDVYTPSLGFTSPAWAAQHTGHHLIFVDVTQNLLFDSEDYRRRRHARSGSDRKTVVMPVLYGGVSYIPEFDLVGDEIIVLDSAHCISPKLDAHYAFFSFHPIKPICMANGGILATKDTDAFQYFERFRNFGRETSGNSYDIMQEGFNFYMNNLNAALGLSQLPKCLKNVQQRKNNFEYLQNIVPSKLGHLVPHDDNSSYYLATLILEEPYSFDELHTLFSRNGVQTTYHYPPLHKTKYYQQDCVLPHLDSIQDRFINLPIHQNLSKQDLNKIAAVVQ